jgi:NAD(P)-dependent dehydrogenase (short-subunit alcohol dehydrogenase family)
MQVSAEGKRVLITAGASGIGRATALAFQEAGASVHVCDLDEGALTAIRLLGIGGSRADVSSSGDVDALFAELEAKWGGLDVLVNNAGIAGPTKPVEDITDDEWNATTGVNINGAFFCVRRAVPMMKRQGGGAIINISSTAGRIGMPLRSPYSTTKYAVRGFADVLAIELGGDNIRVNAVLPGLIDGPRGKRVVDEQADAKGIDRQKYLAAMLHNISLHALISMEEVAAMVLYLASDWGRHISGQSFGVCGNFESYRSPLTIAETELSFSALS